MATNETLLKIKTGIRIKHDRLDDDVMGDIDAGLADLALHGIIEPQETDPLIFNAIKLWCRSLYTEDPEKAEMWRQRYVSLRDSLKMAEGYGWKEDVPDE